MLNIAGVIVAKFNPKEYKKLCRNLGCIRHLNNTPDIAIQKITAPEAGIFGCGTASVKKGVWLTRPKTQCSTPGLIRGAFERFEF